MSVLHGREPGRESDGGKEACCWQGPAPSQVSTAVAAGPIAQRNTGEQDRMPFLTLLLSCFLFLPLQSGHGQSISTSTPVPPLQWINLSGLLQGPAAPPLKDASIGYDNSTRTLIIFGGESQGGLPQQQTYLCVFSSFVAPFAFLKLSSHSPQSQPRHPHLVPPFP
jgi:hypothetical protein